VESPVIEFVRATLGYGRRIILRDISLAIQGGDYLGVVGPNGAGKTTLVRAILGTLRPRSGEVRYRGPNGRPLRFGYVPQKESVDYVLPYTSREVVLMGRYRDLGILRRPGPDDQAIVEQSLDQTGVRDLGGEAFKNLSGGQKQRVLIARALATRPDVLVLDEPTNGMDLPSRLSILDLIRSIHDRGSLTIIMVSHLLDDVASRAKQVAIVERDFFQAGTVEEILTDRNLSALYGIPVSVERRGGRTVILAGGSDGNS
jgi:manganese/zinc/iron transport system ATP- binding protein